MSTTRSPNRDDNAAYKVGYGKPPQHTRFAPGRSGNPQGRPKGVRNFGTDVKATLKAPVKVTRDGRPRNVSTQEAMLLRLREKALNGDARALDRLLQLAQTYNNEDVMTDVASLGADDAMVLETYRARVLSRAAGSPLSAVDNSDVSPIANGSTDLGAADHTDVRPNTPRRLKKSEKPPRREGGAS